MQGLIRLKSMRWEDGHGIGFSVKNSRNQPIFWIAFDTIAEAEAGREQLMAILEKAVAYGSTSSEETFRKLSSARLIRIYKGRLAGLKTIAENLRHGGKPDQRRLNGP
jgi:hypothetical protein